MEGWQLQYGHACVLNDRSDKCKGQSAQGIQAAAQKEIGRRFRGEPRSTAERGFLTASGSLSIAAAAKSVGAIRMTLGCKFVLRRLFRFSCLDRKPINIKTFFP
jgi:hypothetical protein